MPKSPGKVALLMRWVGIAAALLSFGSAVYGVLSAQADLRERNRLVQEQLAAARSQAQAADYPGAWDSLERASATAAVDGLFAKLLGGLSAQRVAVRTAQEDVAMDWIRSAQAPEGHTFSEIADKVAVVLARGADASTGERKADLLAHLGWSYFLKQRDGSSGLQPQLQYREAVAADATNPYANAFWGHYILWNHGSLPEAEQHFGAALATPRARSVVREFELAALNDSDAREEQAQWWRTVDAMRKDGEPLTAHWRHEMAGKYYFALDDPQMKWLLSVLPAGDHVALQRMLLESDSNDQVTVTAAMAIALEADGRKEEALAAWHEVQADTAGGGGPGITLRRDMDAALKRLGAGHGATKG